jgi:hypothetical protein
VEAEETKDCDAVGDRPDAVAVKDTKKLKPSLISFDLS